MDHAAETIKQLTTLLAPQFEGLNGSVSELKTGISELRTTITELTKVLITATDDIKVLKDDYKEHEAKILKIEETTQENAEGVKDFKRTKTLCIAAVSAAAGLLTAVAGWSISAYYEYRNHQEDIAYKQSVQESYAQLATIVTRLEQKVSKQ